MQLLTKLSRMHDNADKLQRAFKRIALVGRHYETRNGYTFVTDEGEELLKSIVANGCRVGGVEDFRRS